MAIWKYKHDRGGDASALSVSITVDGRHGVIGLNGIAPASGFPDAAIDSTGNLKAFDGTTFSDFVSGAARPGIDPDPDTYRLTVRKGGLPISSVTFQPVLSSSTATELDINALVTVGKALTATPEQLINLAQATALVPQMTQSLADSAQSRDEMLAANKTFPYLTDVARNADLANRANGDVARTVTSTGFAYHLKQAGAWTPYGFPLVNPEGAALAVNFIPGLNRGLAAANSASYNAGKLQDLVLEGRDTGRAILIPLEQITVSAPIYIGANVKIVSDGHGMGAGYRNTSPVTQRTIPKPQINYTGSGYAFRPETDALYMTGLEVKGLAFTTTSGLGAVDLSQFQMANIEACSFSVLNADPLAYALKLDGTVTGNYWNTIQRCAFHGGSNLGSGVLLTGGQTDGANGNRVLHSRFMKLRRGVTVDHPLTAYTFIENNYFEFTDIHIEANGLVSAAFNNHESKGLPSRGSAYSIRAGGRQSVIVHNNRVAEWLEFLTLDVGVSDALLTYVSHADQGPEGVIGRNNLPGLKQKAVLFADSTTVTRDVQALPAATTITERENQNAPITANKRTKERYRLNTTDPDPTKWVNEIGWSIDDQTGLETKRAANAGALLANGFCSGNPNLNPVGGVVGYGIGSMLRDTTTGRIYTKRTGFSSGTGWGAVGSDSTSINNAGAGGAIVLGVGYEWADNLTATLYNNGSAWTNATLPAPKYNGQRLTVIALQGLTLTAGSTIMPATDIPMTINQLMQCVGFNGTWRKVG